MAVDRYRSDGGPAEEWGKSGMIEVTCCRDCSGKNRGIVTRGVSCVDHTVLEGLMRAGARDLVRISCSSWLSTVCPRSNADGFRDRLYAPVFCCILPSEGSRASWDADSCTSGAI